MKSLLLISLIVFCSSHLHATTREEVNTKTKEAVDATLSYTKEQKEEAEKNIKQSIDGLEKDIASLKQQASQLTGEAKVRLNDQIMEMEAKQSTLKNDFDKLKKASGAAWAEMRKGLSKAYEGLAEGYQKAKVEIKKASK